MVAPKKSFRSPTAGSESGPGRGLGVSVRSGSVDTGTKRMVTKQNKAAESYKIKDLDTLEKGRRNAPPQRKQPKLLQKRKLIKIWLKAQPQQLVVLQQDL